MKMALGSCNQELSVTISLIYFSTSGFSPGPCNVSVLLSVSLLFSFSVCNPSVGIVFTNTSERMGICQGCLEKRCDSVGLWDCYMSAEAPAYECSSLPCSLPKQTKKNLHLCVSLELSSCQTAQEPSA